MGLEPIPFVCKTNVLPVILHSLLDEVGFEPTSLDSQDLASLHNNHSVTRPSLIYKKYSS
jgi:hypothetical protein